MPFVPRLPSFHLSCTIVRLNNLGIWVPDVLPSSFQHYFPTRTLHFTNVDDYYSERGSPGSPDWQTTGFYIYMLFPKTVVIRGPLEVRAETGFAIGARDYLVYNNPNIGSRTYWIDLVEPRWAGFSNEHKVALCTQRGYNP